MSELKSYQLTHPDLLSETELRDMLKKSCIEMLNFETLSKSKLVEIYKRVALPLPQRSCENKSLEVSTDGVPDKKSLNSKIEENHKNDCQSDRLRLPITTFNCSPNKIQLSTSHRINNGQKKLVKRKCEEEDETKLCQKTKHQKITWP